LQESRRIKAERRRQPPEGAGGIPWPRHRRRADYEKDSPVPGQDPVRGACNAKA
jgi:hypothetical protein